MAENSIRPFLCSSARTGDLPIRLGRTARALLSSLIETAHANNCVPSYFCYIFTHLPSAKSLAG